MLGERSGRSTREGLGQSSPFLLLGHHRSGTNFLTDVFQAHSRVSVIDEPLSMHTRAFPDTDLHCWKAGDYDAERLHEELVPYPRSVYFFHQLVRYIANAEEGFVRGFKETLLFEKMPWLIAAVPGIKILHVVRDPRAVVASLLKHDVDARWRYAERLAVYFRRNRDSEVEARCATPLERCVTSWKVRQYELRRGIVSAPHITFRLEDVLRNDVEALGRAMAFIGLELELEQLKLRRTNEQQTRGGMYSTHRSRDEVLHDWKRRLSTAEREFVVRHCERELNEFGYDA